MSMEKEMATHFNILAWRIPWTEETGGPQSMGSQRVGHDWATLLLSFSHSLWTHGLQHAGLPWLSPCPGACSNSCPLSQWCHPNISSSVVHFSSCLQSFPASGTSLMSQLFTLGGQNIEASASASALLMNRSERLTQHSGRNLCHYQDLLPLP